MFTFTILWPDGSHETGAANWPAKPSLEQIHDLVAPLIGGTMERVRVLDPAKVSAERVGPEDYRDMFVHDVGHMRVEPQRNEAATALYRGNYLRLHPEEHPDGLPYIVGVAVLFDQVIWT